VGEPHLLVVGAYRMGFEIRPDGAGSLVRIFIDYDRPTGALTRWLGRFLGGWYARWCVDQMLTTTTSRFAART